MTVLLPIPHVAVGLNNLGVRLGECLAPATTAGYEQLLDWARALGQIVTVGVEGTGSYGRGLTRFLQRQGLQVTEVSRPSRRDVRRLHGKNDALDAEQAARQVLCGQATAIAKTTEGTVEMLWVIKVARDTDIKAQTAYPNRVDPVLLRSNSSSLGSKVHCSINS